MSEPTAELGRILVIIPTYNEAENVRPIVERVRTSVPALNVPAGGTFRLKVTATRRNFDGPVTLALRGDAATYAVKQNTIPAGKSETRSEISGGVSVMWAISIAAGVCRGYGTEPVSASQSTQPSE